MVGGVVGNKASTYIPQPSFVGIGFDLASSWGLVGSRMNGIFEIVDCLGWLLYYFIFLVLTTL